MTLNLSQVADPPADETNTERRRRFSPMLKKLEFKDLKERKDRNPDRVEGTCQWFITHPLYVDWKQSQQSRLLWVSANPGCGKSVLAKFLVDTVLPTEIGHRTTCYFFFKDLPDQKSMAIALSAILRQIFEQNPILLSNNRLDKYEDDDHLANSIFKLWEVLTEVVEDYRAGEIVCILDAIDECEREGWSQLARFLRKYYGTTRTGSKLKFLLTSRPYIQIKHDFQPLEIPGLPEIHLGGEGDSEMKDICREIDMFINARTKELQSKLSLGQAELSLLRERLTGHPNRTYLWVHLTLDLIESYVVVDKAGIRNATNHLPKGVDEAYDQLLCRSPDPSQAKDMLHMIVAAERPFTLREMALAWAVRNYQPYDEPDIESENKFRTRITHICGLLVIVEESRIYLLHQTAKEFLVQQDSGATTADNNSDGRGHNWKGSLHPRDSHSILSKICIRYLLSDEFETQPLDHTVLLSEYLDNHVFLSYSAKYWAIHFQEAHIEDDAVIQLAIQLCNSNSNPSKTWLTVYWSSKKMNPPQEFTSLMIGAYFGMVAVVRHLFENSGTDSDSKDATYGRTALSWAAGNGFYEVCKLLIKGNNKNILTRVIQQFKSISRIDTLDNDWRTPLSYAVWNGNEDVIKLLLKHRAKGNKVDRSGGTPLSYAVCSGRKNIISLLLKNETEMDAERTARKLLSSAVRAGDVAVVRLLLESTDISLNGKDSHGLMLAAITISTGNAPIMKLLIETDKFNVAERDVNGHTLLSKATSCGQAEIMMLLIETGKFDITERDSDGRTILSRAAGCGHVATTRLLLETGKFDIDETDAQGHRPFWWASINGHDEVVGILIKPLYERALREIESSEDYEVRKDILASLAAAYEPLTLEELALFVLHPDLRCRSLRGLEESVAACHTFVHERQGKIRFVHKSGRRYLRNEAKIFPAGLAQVHRILYSRSLEAMSAQLRYNIYGLDRLGIQLSEVKTPDPDPLTGLRYACTHWAYHWDDWLFDKSEEQKNNQDSGTAYSFLSEFFFFWLEALSLMKSFPAGLGQMQRLSRTPKIGNSNRSLIALARHSVNFISDNYFHVEVNPLQIYISGPVFSPTVYRIPSGYWGERLKWIILNRATESPPMPYTHIYTGHMDNVKALAISPDGQYIAAASDDKTIDLWEITSGGAKQTFASGKLFKGLSSGRVMSLEFFPSGQYLASVMDDMTVTTWDVASRKMMNSTTFSNPFPRSSMLICGELVFLDKHTYRLQFGTTSLVESTSWHVSHSRSTYAVSRDEQWVTYDGQPVLRIPPKHRPTTAFAVWNSQARPYPSTEQSLMARVAFACQSGKIIVLGFSQFPPNP